jgi:pimeloyl-ACP methyl ester carboxylesterase
MVGAAREAGQSPATQPGGESKDVWLLHLPGIGGEMPIDHAMTRGLKDGGYASQIEIYDWTEHDPGLGALLARQRNEREAKKISQMIEKRLEDNPKLQITLTSHSAGTGLAVWALEKLPDGMQVQTLVMLASALSPKYDLTAALKHVRGKAYLYYSSGDTLVLGAGTKLFGTVDGVNSEAAGLVGFSRPKGADEKQYDKLVQVPYDKGWLAYHDAGDHIGCMSRSFARHVLAPIVLEGLEHSERSPKTAGSE